MTLHKEYKYPRFLSLAIIMTLVLTLNMYGANPIVNVEGEYTYYASSRDSRDDARRIALLEARNNALAKEFGTIVQSTQISTMNSYEGNESEKFLALSSIESKGEWIADDGEPKFTFSINPDEGTLIVNCKVKGSARSISNEATDFNAFVTRNDPNSSRNDTNFNDGDQMYLHVASPVSAYIAVFLADESGKVFQMLPYPGSHIDEIKISKNKDYCFFNPSEGNEFGQVQEMLLTAPEGVEYNQMYVVLSPMTFSLPAMTGNADRIPPSTSQEDFARWMVKSRKADPKMGVQQINLTIKS